MASGMFLLEQQTNSSCTQLKLSLQYQQNGCVNTMLPLLKDTIQKPLYKGQTLPTESCVNTMLEMKIFHTKPLE